jgi:hypothetical protein
MAVQYKFYEGQRQTLKKQSKQHIFFSQCESCRKALKFEFLQSVRRNEKPVSAVTKQFIRSRGGQREDKK